MVAVQFKFSCHSTFITCNVSGLTAFLALCQHRPLSQAPLSHHREGWKVTKSLWVVIKSLIGNDLKHSYLSLRAKVQQNAEASNKTVPLTQACRSLPNTLKLEQEASPIALWTSSPMVLCSTQHSHFEGGVMVAWDWTSGDSPQSLTTWKQGVGPYFS